MLLLKDQWFLHDLLYKAFLSQEEVSFENIGAAMNYILLDASDIYQRIMDDNYPDTLIYSAIELCLYREKFFRTAEAFRKNAEEKKNRIFQEIKEKNL